MLRKIVCYKEQSAQWGKYFGHVFFRIFVASLCHPRFILPQHQSYLLPGRLFFCFAVWICIGSKTQWASDQTGLSNRFIKNVEALSEAKPALTLSGDKTHTIQIEMASYANRATRPFAFYENWHDILHIYSFKPNIYIFHEFHELKIVAVAESSSVIMTSTRRCLGVNSKCSTPRLLAAKLEGHNLCIGRCGRCLCRWCRWREALALHRQIVWCRDKDPKRSKKSRRCAAEYTI